MSETEHDFTTKTGKNITFYNLEEKECPRCLTRFFPKHPVTVYCNSEKCKKIGYKIKYQNKSATTNRKKRLPSKNCIICEKEFIPRALSNKGVCGDIECRYQQRLRQNRDNKKRNKRKPNYHPHHIKQYGLTLEQYEGMLEFQEHKCKICGEEESAVDKTGTIRRLAIDHDHDTGQIRGLLCRACNTALGSFKDNVESLKRAILYLEGSKHSTVYMPENTYLAKKFHEKNSE
mgnify:CR=1 FL=1